MSEEEKSNAEGEEEDETQPRIRSIIQSRHDAEEKVMRSLRNLNVSYNPVTSGMGYEEDLSMVRGTNESYDNPEIFKKLGITQTKVRENIGEGRSRLNFNDMIKTKVWRSTRVEEIPKDRRLIGS